MSYKNVRPFSTYSLLLTEDCNLACKYCYEVMSTGHKKKKMTKETADQFLKFAVEEALKEEKNRKISVSFFGGEPILNIDLIDYICEQGKEINETTDIKFFVHIVTNATLMNEKIYNILRKHSNLFTSCQLSIDGPHDIQDSNRVTKSGKGSFNIIEKNIPYWKSLFGDKLNIHGVLSKDSIHRLYESFIYFRETWGVKNTWFLPFKDDRFTDDDVEIYDREMGKIYNYIMDSVRKNKNIDEIKYNAPLDRCLKKGKADKPCGAGDAYCAVTSEGDIYPCHHLYYIEPGKNLYMGNVFDGVDLSKKYIWSMYDSKDMIGCQECEHPSCFRCIAENYEKYKTPFVQIKGVHCKFMHIDLKYQKLIREEIEKMGLMETKKENNRQPVKDCVGKVGECPIVTSIEECVFDRGDCKPAAYKDVVAEQNIQAKEICSCDGSCKDHGKEDLVDMVDEIIGVLVKYHTKWSQK